MNDPTIYLFISAIVMILLGSIWQMSDWPNIIIKFGLYGLGAWGIFLALIETGYIIKV